MIYFTSDLHFGHYNIIKYCNRPFKSVEDMDETIINNWNNIVKEDDNVFILGDITLSSQSVAEKYLERLKGNKYLIIGNHDMIQKSNMLIWEKDYCELSHKCKLFVLSHYPFLEWNGMYRGSIHLHGHQHNHSDYNKNQKCLRYDVGVDANDFRPVSIEKIIRWAEKHERNS